MAVDILILRAKLAGALGRDCGPIYLHQCGGQLVINGASPGFAPASGSITEKLFTLEFADAIQFLLTTHSQHLTSPPRTYSCNSSTRWRGLWRLSSSLLLVMPANIEEKVKMEGGEEAVG